MTVWEQWSKQAAELQLLHAAVENRKKAGDYFYKMDQESIITIRGESTEDFEAMAQEQITGIRRLLEEFEDDQLDMTLQLEAYERERKRLARQQPPEQVNLSDEEQQTKPRTSIQQQSEQH